MIVKLKLEALLEAPKIYISKINFKKLGTIFSLSYDVKIEAGSTYSKPPPPSPSKLDDQFLLPISLDQFFSPIFNLQKQWLALRVNFSD